MAGNVWDWCHSLYRPYPYRVDDGRESESGTDPRVLRGGAYYVSGWLVRCAFRRRSGPDDGYRNVGFRVVVASPL